MGNLGCRTAAVPMLTLQLLPQIEMLVRVHFPEEMVGERQIGQLSRPLRV